MSHRKLVMEQIKNLGLARLVVNAADAVVLTVRTRCHVEMCVWVVVTHRAAAVTLNRSRTQAIGSLC